MCTFLNYASPRVPQNMAEVDVKILFRKMKKLKRVGGGKRRENKEGNMQDNQSVRDGINMIPRCDI